MQKPIEFRVNGKDPSLASLKAMLTGVGTYMNDSSLQVIEQAVVMVTTERSDVASVLASLAKSGKVAKAAGQADHAPEKRKYNTKRRKAEALDDEGVLELIEDAE